MLTRDEILRIAEAEGYYMAEYRAPDGVVVHVWADGCITNLLETVAASAAAAERKAILSEVETGIWFDKTTEEVLAEIAAAIRARGEAQP